LNASYYEEDGEHYRELSRLVCQAISHKVCGDDRRLT